MPTPMQVRWEVEPEEGAPFAKWWGARLDRQAAPEAAAAADGGDEGAPEPSYVICYDPEDGFEVEERTVVLLSQRELVLGLGRCDVVDGGLSKQVKSQPHLS